MVETATRNLDRAQVGKRFKRNMLKTVRSLRDCIVDELEDQKTGYGEANVYNVLSEEPVADFHDLSEDTERS